MIRVLYKLQYCLEFLALSVWHSGNVVGHNNKLAVFWASSVLLLVTRDHCQYIIWSGRVGWRFL